MNPRSTKYIVIAAVGGIAILGAMVIGWPWLITIPIAISIYLVRQGRRINS